MRPFHAIASASLALALNLLWVAGAPGRPVATFQLNSPAFSSGSMIPAKYTCDGAEVSPALSWNDPPASTKTFALIVDDPDAPGGIWVHWVIYDIPANVRGLPEGVPKSIELQNGARQGWNDFRKIGYGGPCPPRGSNHRYSFRLYALDRYAQLPASGSKSDLEREMKGHILAQAELVGRYQH